MVALISGNGLGLLNASINTTGAGQQGQGAPGQRSYVNAATGNLVLLSQDEQLSGVAQNLLQLRTYNSLGGQTDGDGDGWRWSSERKIALSGTTNTTGSTVSRTTGDGHVAVYTWNASNSRYESHEGDASEDTLVWNSASSTWTWTDGRTRNKDTYNSNGQLTQQIDASGNTITYAYASGRLSSITDTASNQKFVLTYAAVPANTTLTRLQKVDTYALTNDANGRATNTLATAVTQVSYNYDSLGRLTSVVTDLTPDTDNSVTDGKVFTTAYSYDGSSFRISQITQGEGVTLTANNSTTVSYIYDSSFRIRTVTDANGSQTFTYSANSTSVTNGIGQNWIYTYDVNNQLTQVQSPAVNGQIITTQYQYDTNGNIIQATNGLGNTVTYQYDANDNCISEIDSLYNTITRTYDANNQLITETHYLTPGGDGVDMTNGLPTDPDAPSTPIPATDPITTRFVYDTNSRLRYTISAEGRVTEYRYNTQGLLISSISYAGGSYAVGGLTATTALTESQLNSWIATQDKTQSTLSQNTYDYRGNLAQTIQYATVDSAGNGVLDNATSITQFIYDEYGNLLKTIAVRGTSRTTATALNAAGNTIVSTYVYDGMGRLISVANNNGTTTTSYSNSNRQVTVTNAAGLTTTSAYDSTGRLINLTQTATGEPSRQALYYYDAAGKLNMVQDAAGGRSYSFYDAADRLQYSVDAMGAVTEYQYNSDNQITAQIQYNKLATTASWFNGTTVIKSLLTKGTAGTDILTDAANDRTTQFAYDSAGRLVTKTDAAGVITTNTYDGDSRLLQTKIVGQTTAEDRITRYFYDNDGNTLGALDAEGYLTENIYNAAGQLIKTIRYANATTLANRANGTFATLKTNLASSNDLTAYFYYDDSGRLIGSVDEKGVLSESIYDAANNLSQSKIYLTAVTASASDTLATLKSRAGTAQATTTNYDSFGRTLKQTSVDGTTTDYEYDIAGRLTRSIVAAGQTDIDGTSAQRGTRTRYNAFSEVTGSVWGVGEATLVANPTAAAINTAIATYGAQKVYDNLGRVIQTIDANGNKSWLYYDEDSRLRFSVNAVGAITETKYNSFDQVVSSTQYSAKIVTTGLTGGVATSAVINSFTALANSAHDQKITFNYDKRGLLISQTDAEGYIESFTYTNAGQLKTDLKTIASGNTTTTQYTYNRRGELTQSIRDTGGLNITTSTVYDAFGRVTKSTDARGKITTFSYTNSGRSITTTDALNRTNKTDYDIFGRTLKSYDAFNNITTYSYDDVNRSSTITTPENISVTTYRTRNGETAKVLDAKGNVTQYQYNKNGQLIKVTDALGNITQSTYDNSGRLSQSIDALGTVTQLSYDAVNRVITRAVDPSGLNLRTQYEFGNGLNQQTKVTEGYGSTAATITTYSYDRNGQLKTIVTDPAGLALQTSYTYDGLGNTLTVSKGTVSAPAQQVTQYTFDKLGRRTKEITDPSGLAITTQYKYDNNDNVTRKIDANGNSTWYVYDAENQLTHTVDALGDVTQNNYDIEGRITQTTNYSTAIATTSFGDIVSSITPIINATADQTTSYVYDKDGRLTKTILDPAGLAITTNKKYDANGNVTRLIDAGNNSTWFVYDANNRLTYTIDALGDVTYNQYDAANNVTQVTYYSTPITTSSFGDIVIGVTPVANAAKDHTTNYVYDKASRQRFSFDAFGNLSEKIFNALGDVIETRQYDSSVQVLSTTARTETALANLRGTRSLGDGTTHGEKYTYDNASRLTSTTDANNKTESYTYDAFGNRASLRNKLNQVWTYSYDKANRLIDEVTPQVNVASISSSGVVSVTTQSLTTHNTYDAMGNVLTSTEAYGTSDARTTSYQYDKLGRQTVTTLPGYYNTLTGVVESNTTANSFARTVTVTYDGLGNAIQNKIQTGVASFIYQTKVYDKLGRVIYDIDALNQVTGFTYDALGNQKTITRYNNVATKVVGATYAIGEVAVIADAVNDRTITNFYDVLGQKIKSVQPSVTNTFISSSTATTNNQNSVGVTANATPITTYQYDAFGQMVKQRVLISGDGNTPATDIWSDTWNYYNNLGQISFSIDAGNYVTEYAYDAFGNNISQTEYANATTLTLNNTLTLAAVQANVNSASKRVTNTGYDALNRRINVTQSNVNYYVKTGIDAAGNATYSATTGNIQSWFGSYDALGNLTQETDALGNTTYNTYNLLGFLTQVTSPNRKTANKDTTGSSVDPFRNQVDAAPVTSYALNAFGQVISETQSSGSGRGIVTGDMVLTHRYDVAGNEIASTDAMGNVVNKQYDAGGHVIRESQQITATFSDWTAGNYSYTIDKRYSYDLTGRQIATTDVYTEAGVQKQSGQSRVYNSFGEVIEERLVWGDASTALASLNKTTLNIYTYDNAGRVSQKQSNDGLTSYYYDLANRNTRVEQRGNNSSSDGTVTRVTETAYDLLGRAQVQRSPQFNAITVELDTATSLVTPINRQSYDRWGNILSRTDATGNTTTYTYNVNNQVTSETLPTGIVVWQNYGSSYTPTIVHEIHYDALGRSVEDVQKANGVVSRVRRSEYNQVGQLTASIDGTNVRTEFAYDAFGHQIGTRNSFGTVLVDKFDANGNQLTHAVLRKTSSSNVNTPSDYYYNPISNVGANSNTPAEVILQSYRYDQAGRRIADGKATLVTQSWQQVWVPDSVTEGGHYEYQAFNITTPGDAQYYKYDERGNTVQYRDALGNLQTTEYDFANRKTKQTDALNNTLTWTYNTQGQLTSHKDLGNHTTSYTYNDFGQMATESVAGNYRSYSYADNGLVKEIKDLWTESYSATVSVTSVIAPPGSEGSGSSGPSSSATFYSYDTITQRTIYDYTINGQTAHEVRKRERTGTRAQTATAYYESNGYYYYAFNTTTINESNIHEMRSAYDQLGRLTQITSPAGQEVFGSTVYNTSTLTSLKYQYDEFGNRMQIIANYTPVGQTYSYSALSYRFDNEGRLTNENGKIIDYDSAGRRLHDEVTGQTVYSDPYTEGPYTFYNTITLYTTQELYRYTDTNQIQSISKGSLAHDGKTFSLQQITTGKDSSLSLSDSREYDQHGYLTKQIQGSTVTTNNYRIDGSMLSQLVTKSGIYSSLTSYSGYDATGNLTHYSYSAYKSNGSLDYTLSYDNEYAVAGRFDSYKQTKETASRSGMTPGVTTFTYDARGSLTKVAATGSNVFTRSFINDVNGQVLLKIESPQGQASWQQNYIYTSSHQVASIGKDNRFDFGVTGTGNEVINTAGNYAVNAGDTLSSIAQSVWGDSSLWYLIANANGINLASDAALTNYVGQNLRIPNVTRNLHNNATTFKPYNPAEIIGDTTPSPTPPPPPKHKCNVLVMIIVVIVAVVVTVYTAGAGAALFAVAAGVAETSTAAVMVGGLVGGVLGSLASQGASMAMGASDSINFKQALGSGIAGALTAGIGSALTSSGSSAIATTAANGAKELTALGEGIKGAASVAASYVGNKIAGVDASFSWKGVAAGFVSSFATKGLGLDGVDKPKTVGQYASNFAKDIASSAVTATTQRVIGVGGKQDWASVAADAFGNALANGIVNKFDIAERGKALIGKDNIDNARARHLLHKAGLDADREDHRFSSDFARTLVKDGRLSDEAILIVLHQEGIRAGLRDNDLARSGGITDEVVRGRASNFIERKQQEIADKLEKEKSVGTTNGEPQKTVSTDDKDVTTLQEITVIARKAKGPDGGTITEKLFSGGVQLVDGFTTFQAEHPILASVAYEATKGLITGGPVKTLVTKIAKTTIDGFVGEALSKISDFARDETNTFITSLGIHTELSIAGTSIAFTPDMFGSGAGELAGGVVDAVLDGGVEQITKRGKNIREVVEIGPHTMGEYRDVAGHHPHQQAARSNNEKYNPREAMTIADDGTFDHAAITAEQRRLNAEFARTGKPYTLEVEENIQRKAMRAGGIKDEHIEEILRVSREKLIEQGALNPTRTPGKRRGK